MKEEHRKKTIVEYNKVIQMLDIVGCNLIDVKLYGLTKQKHDWEIMFYIKGVYNNPRILYQSCLGTIDDISNFIDLRGEKLSVSINYRDGSKPFNRCYYGLIEMVEAADKYGYSSYTLKKNPKYSEYRKWKYNKELERAHSELEEFRSQIIQRNHELMVGNPFNEIPLSTYVGSLSDITIP